MPFPVIVSVIWVKVPHSATDKKTIIINMLLIFRHALCMKLTQVEKQADKLCRFCGTLIKLELSSI